MVSITLAVSEDLHILMQKHKDVKWSEVARQAIMEKARKLELMDTLLTKSELTEEDAERIGHTIKRGMAKKYGLIR